MSLLVPVASYTHTSSWAAHQRRRPPSSEPGTDLYCRIGSHLVAPDDGWIWGSGESIGPATGRWVGINFDNGMSYRSLHHSRNRITQGRVKRGDVYAFSGASGYGEEDWSWNVAETGGAHVHATLWPTHDHRFGYRPDGTPYTIDLMEHVGGLAGDGSTPFPTPPIDEEEDDDMQAFVKVTRDDASLFVVVGRGGAVNPVPTSEAALRGVDKILEAFRAEDENTPTVTISGEEWDAGALRAFGVG